MTRCESQQNIMIIDLASSHSHTSQCRTAQQFLSNCFSLPVFYASRSEKPVITQRPYSQNVYVNKSATFICRAQSPIPFEREWKKDDSGLLLCSVPGFLLIANESLTFLNARRSDVGIYTCIVRNSDGTSSAQAKLSVLGRFAFG